MTRMRRTRRTSMSMIAILVIGLGAMIAAAPLQKPSSAETLMGAGLHQEEVEGNYEEAIATYKKVITDRQASRALAARAQLHIGLCYEKLGDAEARKAYDRVVRDYANQSDSVAAARARLAAMDKALRSSVKLSAEKQILHALSRLTFGARPGDRPGNPDGGIYRRRREAGEMLDRPVPAENAREQGRRIKGFKRATQGVRGRRR